MLEKKIFKIAGVSLILTGLYWGISPITFNTNRNKKIKNLQEKNPLIEYIIPAEETLKEMNRSIYYLSDNSLCYVNEMVIPCPPEKQEIEKARSHLEKAIEIFDSQELSEDESIIQEMNFINNNLIYQKKNWQYEIGLIKKQKDNIKEYFNNRLPKGIVIKEPPRDTDYLSNIFLGILGVFALSMGFSKEDEYGTKNTSA
ncbi:MAG: hypothetical protein WC867_01090 [Candidatus Pacearchaeota archaeon]|jgi:hypothetical protein